MDAEQRRAACVAGMAASQDARAASDFDAYIDLRFGRAVADAFMRPSNRKPWGYDLSRLTTDWTGERVTGRLRDVERFQEQGGHRTPLQAETTIAYPPRGGFGRIFEARARRLEDLRLETAMVRIDPRRRTLTTGSGQTLAWGRIVSTLPLPALLAAVPDVPPTLREAVADTLEEVPVDLVMVELEGRGPIDRQRVYCPDPETAGHKIVLNHTSSQWLRGRPRHGIQVEVSCVHGKHKAGLTDTVIDDLVRIGLIEARSDVRRCEILHLPYGYSVPTHARESTQ